MALQALAWVLSDDDRAHRFMALTGLTPDVLRGGLDDQVTQQAVLDFLCGHEPDLLAAAEALEIEPATIVQAREGLAQ
ncbi:DUF3572 family protein [Altererythrobacter endophyticus]|uniref:DUF3572 family protein n=1 Tax=Altericroceibacterium endophyticum TaxID=1808508 RepID=A0A6I4T3K2_9SPHN|nr:DUF3572 family protein [Altericroceibacterium endophyticum]